MVYVTSVLCIMYFDQFFTCGVRKPTGSADRHTLKTSRFSYVVGLPSRRGRETRKMEALGPTRTRDTTP